MSTIIQDGLVNGGICYLLGLSLALMSSALLGITDNFMRKFTRYNLTDSFCNLVIWSISAPAFVTGTLLLIQAFLI